MNYVATYMKAMDLNKHLVFSSPHLDNLYKIFTKPLLYLSFQDELLTRVQITCLVNPKKRYTCTRTHIGTCMHTLFVCV